MIRKFIFDGKYEVYSDGYVVSHARKNPTRLIGKVSNCGYRSLLLTVNKKRIHALEHRLVAKCFLKNSSNKKEVNHKDGNKLNNNVKNLEWVTSSENQKHAYDNGHQKCIINFKDACDIRKSKLTPKELAEKYKLSRRQIYSILNNKKWVR